jgi:outer membrane autotransporter protein
MQPIRLRDLAETSIGPAGTLAGHGTIGGSVSNISGIMVPGGSSIGTLTVGGNFTQGSFGTLAVEVSPTGASQLVVGGKASLAGTLALIYDPGTYSAKTYTLLQAASVTGSFSIVTGQVPTPGLTQSVSIDPTNAELALTEAPAALTVAPTNDTIFPAMTSALILNGQRANLMVLDRLGARLGGGADAPAVANLIAPAASPLARAGSSNLATLGEIATALPQGMAQYGGWFRGIGSFASLNGNATAPSFGANSGGFLIGIDRPVEPDFYLGAATGYIYTGVQEHSTSNGDTDTGRFMVYGGGWAGRRCGPRPQAMPTTASTRRAAFLGWALPTKRMAATSSPPAYRRACR